jgi:hypothetical protein
VPDFLSLRRQRRNQMRMAMAERVDRNAGRKIKIALTLRRHQPHAFASLEGEIDTGICRQKV